MFEDGVLIIDDAGVGSWEDVIYTHDNAAGNMCGYVERTGDWVEVWINPESEDDETPSYLGVICHEVIPFKKAYLKHFQSLE